MKDAKASPQRSLGLFTATFLVVASMVGTGVFTTTGFLIRDLSSIPAVLGGWAVGGLVALMGARAYGGLGVLHPQSGGEYHLVSRIFHPALGFVAGIISVVVGFAAPVAAAAHAFGAYTQALFPQVPALPAGLFVLVLFSALHGLHLSLGTRFQDGFTLVKIALIVGFIGAALLLGDFSGRGPADPQPAMKAMLSPAFAVGLIYITFSYSGWNAAIYVAGEVKEPARTLPRALLLGTLIVTGLYVALNWIFLYAAPVEKMAGVVEVGHVAATGLFGAEWGWLMSALIAGGLFSTVGALLFTGARVCEALGRDHKALSMLTRRNVRGAPHYAVGLLGLLSVIMLLVAGFEALLSYVGFTLTIFAAITVAGLFVLWKKGGLPKDIRRLSLFPVGPLIFLSLSGWMVVHAVMEKPQVALVGLGSIVGALLLYVLVAQKSDSQTEE
jgi:APA family basic amino acid/polyamine antiporter